MKSQRAQTISIGLIVEPDIVPGLRVSLDYSRLRTSNEIGDYAAFDSQYFIDHEDLYPGRVIRAPLTAADIAQGFTAGRITLVDSTYLTVGRSTLEVVAIALDLARTGELGSFHFSSRGSWEPTLTRRGNPDLPAYNSVNSVSGPLAVRANAGMDWTKGAWSAGLNAQAYGAYRVTYSYQKGSAYEPGYVSLNRTAVLEQGRSHIPAQVYLDGYIGWRATIDDGSRRAPEISLRLGIRNLLDKRAPTVVPATGQGFSSLGYSYYGDARGRRLVLDVSAKM